MKKERLVKLAIAMALAACFFYMTPPDGLKPAAWHLFGIFLATILALMLQVLPEAATLLISVACAGLLTVPLKDILTGYTDPTLWLIVLAIMISLGFKKTGLTRRIGLWMLDRFGTTTLRIGYVLSCMDLLLATSTPAAPARGGGLIYPLAEGVLDACDANDTTCPRKLGAYLTVLGYMASMTTGAIFMTGMGPNLFNAKLAKEMLGITVTWPQWTMAALPIFIGFLLTPWIIYKVYPPEIHSLESIRQSVVRHREALGPVTRGEMFAGGIFLLILGLWATSSWTGMDATLVAFIGVSLMLVLDIVQWKDIAATGEAWAILIWFGAIIGLSSALGGQGFFTWFAAYLKSALPTEGLNTYTVLLIISLLATLPHYLFASLVGYAAAFAPLLFTFVAATGAPKYPAFFLIAYLMVISSTLTHYGNGLGPMLIGKGFNDKKTWWGIGLLLTTMHLVLCLTVGVAYWKFIGLWQ